MHMDMVRTDAQICFRIASDDAVLRRVSLVFFWDSFYPITELVRRPLTNRTLGKIQHQKPKQAYIYRQ